MSLVSYRDPAEATASATTHQHEQSSCPLWTSQSGSVELYGSFGTDVPVPNPLPGQGSTRAWSLNITYSVQGRSYSVAQEIVDLVIGHNLVQVIFMDQWRNAGKVPAGRLSFNHRWRNWVLDDIARRLAR